MGVSTIQSLNSMVDSKVDSRVDSRVDKQIDNKFGDDIGDNVTAWLTEHVTPSGSAVVVDDTLTIAGAAADAKKTGDEITGLKNAIRVLASKNESFQSTGSASWKFSWSELSLPTSGRYFITLIGGISTGAFRVTKAVSFSNNDIVVTPDLIYDYEGTKVYTFEVTDAQVQTITNIAYASGNTTSAFSVRYAVVSSVAYNKIIVPMQSDLIEEESSADSLDNLIGHCLELMNGVEDISTTKVNGVPIFDIEKNPTKIIGYGTQDWAKHIIIDVSQNEIYKIRIPTQAEKPFHVFQTDTAGNIIRKTVADKISPSASGHLYEGYVRIINPNVTKLVLYGTNGNWNVKKINTNEIKLIQTVNNTRKDFDDFRTQDLSTYVQAIIKVIEKNNGTAAVPVSNVFVGRPTFADSTRKKITGADGQTWASLRYYDCEPGSLYRIHYIPSILNVTSVFVIDDEGYVLFDGSVCEDTFGQPIEYDLMACQGATKIAVAETTNGTQYVTKADPNMIIGQKGLPQYYYENNYWPNKIAEISEASNIKNGIVFAFWTDPHFAGLDTSYANPQNSKYMLKDLLDQTTIEFVVCGGDIPAAGGSETILKDSEIAYINYARVLQGRLYGVRGNHDLTIQTEDESNPRITLPYRYTYNMFMRSCFHNAVGMENSNGYYFVDFPKSKIRMIFVNMYEDDSTDPGEDIIMYMTNDQYDWIANTIITSPYDIVMVGHVPIDPNISGSMNDRTLFNIVEAVKNKHTYNTYDFTGLNVSFIAYFSGHVHNNNIETTNNVLSITTSSDSYYNVSTGEQRAARTISEQAFDVVIINKDTQTITLKRCGAGSDRTATYT